MDSKVSTQDMLRRKSVRAYSSEWSGEHSNEILQAAANLIPLIPGIAHRFVRIENDNVLGQGKADAPCYVALYSAETEGWQENAGFLLYQLMLILSKNGVGTAPLSGTKPKTEPGEAKGMSLVIVFSAGLPGEELYRNPLDKKNRKEIDEISANLEAKSLIEYARIAPSSGNGQPWYFAGDGSRIDIYAQLAGDQFNTSNTELKLLDVGIACYGLYVAAQEAGRYGSFLVDKDGCQNSAPKGYMYNRSLLLK